MCGILGVYVPGGSVTPGLVERSKQALAALHHRGPDASCLKVFEHGILASSVLNITGDCLQPLVNRETALAYNGEIYNYRELAASHRAQECGSDTQLLFNLLHDAGEPDSIIEILQRLDGDFALALMRGEGVVLTRDPVGVKPLYYALCKDRVFFFASERRALALLTNTSEGVHAVAPGTVLYYNGGLVEEVYRAPLDLEKMELCEGEGISALAERLHRAVEKRRHPEVAVAFSGGLDSSLLAHLLQDECDVVELFTVCMRESYDEAAAVGAARLLEMKEHLHLYTLCEEEVERLLPEVCIAVESRRVMDVGIALPLYVAARQAHESGLRVMFSGQGADELFAGYRRYESMKPLELEEALRQDFRNISRVNLERDDKASMAHSVELRVPFLDRGVVECALSLPADLKLNQGVRKYVLRRAAQQLELPGELVWADKKAAQYSSGVHRALRRLARKRGYGRDVQAYLNSLVESLDVC